MSDALELLRPFVTEHIAELLRQRLLTSTNFFDAGVLKPEYDRGEVKLTLLLVRMANATEPFNADEEDLISTRMKPRREPRQEKVKPVPGKSSQKPEQNKPEKASDRKTAKAGSKVGVLKTKGETK